ncbi:MAG: SRPBCC family protein [bacterium]
MADFSIFERSVLLDAPASEVYAFHEDPRNITKISPPSLKVERVECSVPAKVGEEFRLRVSQFGLPLEWIGIWEEAAPDSRLVDGARKSPFRHWRHQHLFRGEGSGTVMTDRVEYALKFGTLGSLGIIGRLLDATVMKAVFTAMFLARHKATAAYFAKERKAGG